MALSANLNRTYEAHPQREQNDLPVLAAATIYAGSVVSESAGTGFAKAMATGEVFMGIAARGADNASGANGDKKVLVYQKGTLVADVVGVTGEGDYGAAVYAVDDETLTLTAGSNTQIGKITRFVSGTKVAIRFEAGVVQSI